MRVTTKITIDIASGEVLSHEYYEYAGPVAEAKKGRETTEKAGAQANQIGDTAIKTAGQDRTAQLGYKAQGDAAAKNLFTMPANGGLNPALADQFSREKEQIGKTYSDATSTGLRGLASRGMGEAPTGMAASITNTNARNAGADTTNAYGQQIQNQLGLGLEGVKYAQTGQQLYDPAKELQVGTSAAGTGAQAGQARSGMGSTLGDIGAGLSGISRLIPAG